MTKRSKNESGSRGSDLGGCQKDDDDIKNDVKLVLASTLWQHATRGLIKLPPKVKLTNGKQTKKLLLELAEKENWHPIYVDFLFQ